MDQLVLAAMAPQLLAAQRSKWEAALAALQQLVDNTPQEVAASERYQGMCGGGRCSLSVAGWRL